MVCLCISRLELSRHPWENKGMRIGAGKRPVKGYIIAGVILGLILAWAGFRSQKVIIIVPEAKAALRGSLGAKMGIIEAIVTAYSSSPDETDEDPLIMASGEMVYDGAAACPRRIPLGTKIVIAGREYVCEDRLARKYDHRFDLWKASKAEAMEFGIRKEKIEIISNDDTI